MRPGRISPRIGNIAQHITTTSIACTFLYFLGWIGGCPAPEQGEKQVETRNAMAEDVSITKEKRDVGEIMGRWEDGRRRDFR